MKKLFCGLFEVIIGFGIIIGAFAFIPSHNDFHEIIIHHSATIDTAGFDFPKIRAYHMQQRHWEDIGYHFVVEQIGGHYVVVKARPLEWFGAHTRGHNSAIGICLVGNFSNEPPSEEAIKELIQLTKELMNQYNILVGSVHKHSDFGNTECPGLKFPWQDFKRRLSHKTGERVPIRR